MERKLKQLFDYQRFQSNKRLTSLLADTESRYAGGLSDDELALVSAAGEFYLPDARVKDGQDDDNS